MIRPPAPYAQSYATHCFADANYGSTCFAAALLAAAARSIASAVALRELSDIFSRAVSVLLGATTVTLAVIIAITLRRLLQRRLLAARPDVGTTHGIHAAHD